MKVKFGVKLVNKETKIEPVINLIYMASVNL